MPSFGQEDPFKVRPKRDGMGRNPKARVCGLLLDRRPRLGMPVTAVLAADVLANSLNHLLGGLRNEPRAARPWRANRSFAGKWIVAFPVGNAALDYLGDERGKPACAAVQHAFEQRPDSRLLASAVPVSCQSQLGGHARK